MSERAAVRYTVIRGVAWVVINRPESRNALGRAVREGLWDAIARFNVDESASVLVLTGAGDKAFCAGGDLKEMADTGLEVPPPDYIPQFGRNVVVDKPTIAAVNGAALGGGFLLAQMCDLVVAAESARFGVTEARVGRGAPWAAPLPLIVGTRAAMEILLTGGTYDAHCAQQMGLVNRVVPDTDLRESVQVLGERIAANAPLSVRAALKTVRLVAELPLSAAFEEAERLWEPVYLSTDAAEGPAAFRDGRTPQWKGC